MVEIKSKFEKNNILFGYGSQADRFLINQSASNGLIYSFLHRIIGFFFLNVYFNNSYLSIKNLIFIIKKLNYEYLLDVSIFVIYKISCGVILLFGIDF